MNDQMSPPIPLPPIKNPSPIPQKRNKQWWEKKCVVGIFGDFWGYDVGVILVFFFLEGGGGVKERVWKRGRKRQREGRGIWKKKMKKKMEWEGGGLNWRFRHLPIYLHPPAPPPKKSQRNHLPPPQTNHPQPIISKPKHFHPTPPSPPPPPTSKTPISIGN